MKRQLNIAYREKIESGEYKVTTRDGRKVRVLCWDVKNDVYPIAALTECLNGEETADLFTKDGRFSEGGSNSPYDLFVEVPDGKIPFDMKYKDDILSGRVKVQTKDGKDVRIISFDGTKEYPIVGVREDSLEEWTTNGKWGDYVGSENFDLVIIKSE